MPKSNGKEKEKEGKQGEQRQGRSMAPYAPQGSMSRGAWPLTRFRSEFDRLFDDFFRGFGGLPALPMERESGWGLDVEDQDDKLIVRAEAPGFEPGDFDVQVRNDQLVLCACQSEETKQDGGRQWHQQELYRSVPLPSAIDTEHVDAQYHNGILTITLPKTEQEKGRRIEVKA